jgi:chromosome segregation ATPase
LQKQLDAAKETSPDNLLTQLNGRIKVFEEELDRLSKDKNTSDERLALKDKQLNNLRVAAETTVDELNRISASLKQVDLDRIARVDALQKLIKERSQRS